MGRALWARTISVDVTIDLGLCNPTVLDRLGLVARQLLALSLVCTLAAAALFQPILMGKPRKVAVNNEFAAPARTRKSGSLSAAQSPAYP
jgi:hypothetical protein